MSFDKFFEKLLEQVVSLGPAAIFFVIAVHECWLYVDPNSPDGDLWKAFWFACAGAAWVFVFKILADLWNEIWQSRRASVANSIVNHIEALNRALRWKLSSFERQYLDCQAYDCYDYRVEGYQPFGIKMLMLEDVFVPLELVGSQVEGQATHMVLQQRQRLKQDPTASSNQDENNWKIWEFLAQKKNSPTYRHIAILAAVGYGKTTLLKHITLSYAKQLPVVREYKAPKLIPILLYLRDLREVFAQDKQYFPSLPDLIHTHHLKRLPNYDRLNVPENWAANLLQTDRALVMFDGFDEVAEARRGDVSDWMSQQMHRYPKAVFILTSRPPGYEKHYTAKRPETTLYVRAFNNKQRSAFLHKWYTYQERYDRGGRNTPDVQATADRQANSLLQQLEQRPKLSELADNPLLLNMIATVHRFHPGEELPKYRAELYANICKLQLVDRPQAKGIPMLLNLENSLRLLRIIALELMQYPSGRLPDIPGGRLMAWIREALVLINPDVKPEQWIEQIVTISELLVKKEDRGNDQDSIYEFAHLSFQEYLAAAQIKTLQQESMILGRFDVTEWRETILLYAAQTNPTPLIQEACRRNTREALQLGYDCVRESPDPVNSQAFQKLQSLRYHTLETYLAQGQWREADQETWRMMLRTVGKGEDQILWGDDLLTFPCDDLRRIDQLWVKYSNGKWGFSVQKAIYVSPEVGGIADGRYDKEAFGKLSDRVGWRKEGRYNYDKLTFDLANSPKGEFPSSYFAGLGWWGLWFSSLAHRLVNCSTSQF